MDLTGRVKRDRGCAHGQADTGSTLRKSSSFHTSPVGSSAMRARRICLVAPFALLAGCATPATSPKPVPQAPAVQPQTDAGPEAIFQSFEPTQVDRIVAVKPHIEAAARRYDLEPELIYGVIWVESRFQPKAKSPAGARGLMQLMPQTAAALAKQMGVARPRSYDPAFNVMAGSYYLRRLLDRYEGDEVLALAAYNAGAGNVNKWRERGLDLPEYSQKYVGAVLEARARFRGTPLDAEREVLLADASDASPPAEPLRADPPKAPAPPPSEPIPAEDESYQPVFEPRPDLDVEQRREPAAPPRDDVRAPPRAPDVGVGLLPGVDE